jgi:hypothetical protein
LQTVCACICPGLRVVVSRRRTRFLLLPAAEFVLVCCRVLPELVADYWIGFRCDPLADSVGLVGLIPVAAVTADPSSKESW